MIKGSSVHFAAIDDGESVYVPNCCFWTYIMQGAINHRRRKMGGVRTIPADGREPVAERTAAEARKGGTTTRPADRFGFFGKLFP